MYFETLGQLRLLAAPLLCALAAKAAAEEAVAGSDRGAETENWQTVGRADCVIRLAFRSARRSPNSSRLVLRPGNQGSALAVEIWPKGIRLVDLPSASARWEQDLPRGTRAEHDLWIRVRRGRLLICLDGQRRASVPFTGGKGLNWRWEERGGCHLVRPPRVQPLAGVYLTDDFMREDGRDRLWEPVSGEWAVQGARSPTHAANAFRFFARSAETGLAIAQSSYWFWSDYRFGAAFQTADSEATFGLAFYCQDSGNYHLFRWREGPALQLVRVRDGKEAALAETSLRRAPQDWCRLEAVVSGGQVAGYVDGNRVLLAKDPSLVGGRIGLYAQSASGVWIDDVAVESVDGALPDVLSTPFGPGEVSSPKLAGKAFGSDPKMRHWANPRFCWGKGAEGLYWSPVRFFGDAKLVFRSPVGPVKKGQVALFAEPGTPGMGYRLRWDEGTLALTRAGKMVHSAKPPAEGVASLEFAVSAEGIRLEANGRALTDTTNRTVALAGRIGADLGPTAAAWATDPDWRDHVRVTSSHRVEYSFDHAPAAWTAQCGVWRSTNRWACVPEWSFLGGRARDRAVLWNKRKFHGDFDLEIAFSPMEATVQRMHSTFPITLNAAFGADGQALDSGYSLVFGTNDIPSRLYRGQQLVATNPALVIPRFRADWEHFYYAMTMVWQRVRIQRQGNTIRVWAARFDKKGNETGMERLFEYQDPAPPSGERFGLWTWGENGMAVARVSLSFEHRSGTAAPRERVEGRPSVRGARRAVNRASGGEFRCTLYSGKYRSEELGQLEFRYRVPPNTHLGLFLRRRMEVAQFSFVGDPNYRPGVIPLGSLDAVPDGEWHVMAVDLHGALEAACPDDPERPIDEIFLASPLTTIEEIAGIGLNRYGAAYEIADIRFRPSRTKPQEKALPPPRVSIYGTIPLDDFESGLGEWQTFGGRSGALLWRDPSGARRGSYGLRLHNPRIGGTAGARITAKPFDARLFPRLRFEYRFPPEFETNLFVQFGGKLHEIAVTGKDASWPVIGRIENITADGQWHRAELDLASALRPHAPEDAPLWVEGLFWADSMRMSNIQNLIYRFDDFCRVPLVPPDRPVTFSLSLPEATAVAAYCHLFDDKPDTTPPAEATGAGDKIRAVVPREAGYLHVRVRSGRGAWSPTSHLPLLVGPAPPARPPPSPKTAPVPEGAPPAPFINYVPSDRLCHYEFDWSGDEEGLGDAMGPAGIRRAAWVLPCLDDGSTRKGCIEAVNLYRDDFYSTFLYRGEYDLRRYPRVSFDYRLEDRRVFLNLTGLLNGEMLIVEWLKQCHAPDYFGPAVVGRTVPGLSDGKWHRVDFDLLKMVASSGRAGKACLPLKLRQLNTWAMPCLEWGYTPIGARIKLDNITIYSPRGRNPAFRWRVPRPDRTGLSYACALDRSPGTEPPAKRVTSVASAEFRGVRPGRWFFHVRARDAKGRWGPTSHLGIEIE